jgi:hypothetical protein
VTRSDCAGFRAVAAELGLGILTGRERGEALGHIESCTDCRRHLDDLTDAADMLVFVAPRVDPPSGFARRTLARLDPGARLRTRRFTRALIAVAAVLILAAGVAITTTLRHQDAHRGATPFPRHNESGIHVAQFVPAAGQQVNGQVVSHAGKQPWIFLIVHDTDPNETYSCELDLANDTHLTVGTFQLQHGTASWGRLLDPLDTPITAARLRKSNGDTEATATIT